MIRVVHDVLCPIEFNLLCDLIQQLGVLKMLLFKFFISFWAFSLTFRVGSRFITAKYVWQSRTFLFAFALVLLFCHISWKSFTSGNAKPVINQINKMRKFHWISVCTSCKSQTVFSDDFKNYDIRKLIKHSNCLWKSFEITEIV